MWFAVSNGALQMGQALAAASIIPFWRRLVRHWMWRWTRSQVKNFTLHGALLFQTKSACRELSPPSVQSL